MKKHILNIRVSDSLINDLETLCEINGESISDITRKALESYIEIESNTNTLEINTDFEDANEFNFSKIVSKILHKGLHFKERDISFLFKQFQGLLHKVDLDDELKENYLQEFKRTKKEVDNLSNILLYYLNNLIVQNNIDNFNYNEFSDFLTNLHSSVSEIHIVYLTIPE